MACETRNSKHGRVPTSIVCGAPSFALLHPLIFLSHFASTNTHVPAPYWAAVSPVLIPLASCNKAADVLIDWFGPEELKQVVGGEKWWQVRGLDGIEAEWVTEKEYLREDVTIPKKLNSTDENILRMEHLETVMVNLWN